MSRVDDADRDVARAAERRALRDQENELRAKQGSSRGKGFASLLPPAEARNGSRQEPSASAPGKREATTPAKEHEQRGRGGAVQPPERDSTVGQNRLRVRRGDEDEARTTAETARARGPAARPARQREADEDGGGEGSGSKPREPPAGSASPGFRINPALMAPVPVTKPKEESSAEGLRALASEIAQKIVERVRVGTDGAGRPEFQIELRSDVLSGLEIRISAHRGKIRASFSAADPAVVKLLRENSDELKRVLGRRNLRLEELRIEERA
jgi:hypothetical protein